jgi:hypothetical protein
MNCQQHRRNYQTVAATLEPRGIASILASSFITSKADMRTTGPLSTQAGDVDGDNSAAASAFAAPPLDQQHGDELATMLLSPGLG